MRLSSLLLWVPLVAAVVVQNDGEATFDASDIADVGAEDIFAAPPVKTRKRIRRKEKKPDPLEEEAEDAAAEVEPTIEKAAEPVEPPPPPFQVEFAVQVKRGDMRRFVVEVSPAWAPVGARRFGKLVDDKFYDGNRFFRVHESFVAQWGINGKPEVNAKWNKKGKVLKDDPRNRQSNANYTLSFATTGPKSRSTQVFVNIGDNSFLNTLGFIPFARVITGQDVVDDLYTGYGDEPLQKKIMDDGNSYLKKAFPNLSYIIKAKRLEGSAIIPDDQKMPAPPEEDWEAPEEPVDLEEEAFGEIPELPEDANVEIDSLSGF